MDQNWSDECSASGFCFPLAGGGLANTKPAWIEIYHQHDAISTKKAEQVANKNYR
jgi:hypothetical protein